MRTNPVQNVAKSVRKMSTAVLVQDQMHTWVRQMALPLISERKVKGALRDVHRRTGVSFSYLRKCFYGWERAEPKASDYLAAREAYYRWIAEHRSVLTARIDEIDRLAAEQEAGRGQFGLAV